MNAPETLYHGTSCDAAEKILSEGLRGGNDDHIWLTDSLLQAQKRAVWAELIDVKLGQPFGSERFAAFYRMAATETALEPVVLSVRAEGLKLEYHGDLVPPLPWETVVVDDCNAWSTSETILIERIGVVGVVDLSGAQIPSRSTIERELREHNANWSDPQPGAPPVPIGRFARAVPEIFDALGASLAEIEDQERSHRWRGVAGAGYRLLEARVPADPAVVFAFSILYDHGEAAGALASRMLKDRLLIFDAQQVELLTAALQGRERAETSADPTIGVCWDANRLTRPYAPGPLSHQGVAVVRIPDQDETNWLWIRNRFNHIG